LTPPLPHLLFEHPLTSAQKFFLNEQLLRIFTHELADFDQTFIFADYCEERTMTKTDYKKQSTLPPLMVGKRCMEPSFADIFLNKAFNVDPAQLVIAFGSLPFLFLTGETNVNNFRGNFTRTRYNSTAICTYTPAFIQKQWKNLPIFLADLTKIRKYLEGSIPQPLTRKLWINPTIDEIRNVYISFRRNAQQPLGVDIETCPSIDQITTISFSTPTEGICIPIWDKDAKPDAQNYWPSIVEELIAWKWIKRFCGLSNTKILQNGLYDMQYMLDAPIELRLSGNIEDTALLQHSLEPEMQKSLGFLASLYLNEPSWKQMRLAAKDEVKADE
jgi:hypothetical protein